MGELIGYMRVSKADGSQVLDLQKDALLHAGVGDQMIYEDFASGKKDDRSGLDACVKALRSGDTLVVWKLDRLGRDLRHLVTTVDDLSKRGVGFRVLSGQTPIDTSTAQGEADVRNLRVACRVRTGVDPGTNYCRAGVRSRPRTCRWSQGHDDDCKDQTGTGIHGQA